MQTSNGVQSEIVFTRARKNREVELLTKYSYKQNSLFSFHRLVCQIERKVEFVNIHKNVGDNCNNTK